MTSQRITSENADLSPVFGRLDGSRRSTVLKTLARADEKLLTLRSELTESTRRSWRSRGIELETYPSGQASIGGYVRDGRLTFAVELRPWNFLHEAPWHPGDPTREMATDAWDVDGTVYVAVDADIDAGQEAALELPVRRLNDPKQAAAALAEACTELKQIAFSRPAEPGSWRPSGRG